MEYKQTQNLNKNELNQITKLIANCNKFDKINLSCPLDEKDNMYFLYYTNNILVSFICLYQYNSYEYEFLAFTLPKYRKCGYFKILFSRLIDFLNKKLKIKKQKIVLYTLVDAFSNHSLKVMDKINAEYIKSEFLMKKNISLSEKNSIEKKYSINKIIEDQNIEEYIIEYLDTKIGEFKLLIFDAEVYLYDFLIYENFRNKAHAYNCFFEIFEIILSKNKTNVNLQVSSDNTLAIKLYKKLEFNIIKELKLYTVNIH